MSAYSDLVFLALHAYAPHGDKHATERWDAYERERQACIAVEEATARHRFECWRRAHPEATGATR